MRVRVVSLRDAMRRKKLQNTLKLSPNRLPLLPCAYDFSGLNDQASGILDNTLKDAEDCFFTRRNDRALLGFYSEKAAESTLLSLSVHGESYKTIAEQIRQYVFPAEKPVWKWGGRELDFNKGPFVMGILNVTPDSFSDGGRFKEKQLAVDHAIKMAEAGAEIIDIGGESTRPGADPVSIDVELDRVIPVIEEIRRNSNVLISIDTYKSAVAGAAIKAGADLVNDISGATFDSSMAPVVAGYDIPLICMHIKGKPGDMQKDPFYEDVMEEIYAYFESRVDDLSARGVPKLVIDPGIGFGKRLEDNLRLISNLDEFRFLGHPLLIGTSRKSFIGNILDRPVDDRLAGTLASMYESLLNGADIIRVHDVEPAADLISMFKALRDLTR